MTAFVKKYPKIMLYKVIKRAQKELRVFFNIFFTKPSFAKLYWFFFDIGKDPVDFSQRSIFDSASHYFI